jgi:hypothetical protein
LIVVSTKFHDHVETEQIESSDSNFPIDNEDFGEEICELECSSIFEFQFDHLFSRCAETISCSRHVSESCFIPDNTETTATS